MMSEKEIRALKRKNVSIDEFMVIVKRLKAKGVTRRRVAALHDGDFLGIHSLDDGKTFVRLHLQKIWIKKYTLSYRTTKTKNGKARQGNELMISNFRLPRGKMIVQRKAASIAAAAK